MKETPLYQDNNETSFRLDDITTQDISALPELDQIGINDIIENWPDKWVKKVLYKDSKVPYYTPRPFEQGMGVGATNNQNIHLIGKVLCDRLGLDYAKIHFYAYEKKNKAYFNAEEFIKWITRPDIVQETLIPDNINIHLLINDLDDANNYEKIKWLKHMIEEKFCVGEDVYKKDQEGEYIRTFFQSDLIK